MFLIQICLIFYLCCVSFVLCGKDVTYRVRFKSYLKPFAPLEIYGGDATKKALAARGIIGLIDHDPESSLYYNSDDWDLLMTDVVEIVPLSDPMLFEKVTNFPARSKSKLCNHCLYIGFASNKCFFALHVWAIRHQLGGGSSIPALLRSFNWRKPAQRSEFVRLYQKQPEIHWIQKPCVGHSGSGIRAVSHGNNDKLPTSPNEPVTFQTAVEPQMLFDGKSFHLRVLIFVHSYHPLRFSLGNEGYVFLAPLKYNGTFSADTSITNLRQLDASNVRLADHLWQMIPKEYGVKTRKMLRQGIVALMATHDQLYGRSLRKNHGHVHLSGDATLNESHLSHNRSLSCFDIMAADVMLTKDYNPWILEVNRAPAIYVLDGLELGKYIHNHEYGAELIRAKLDGPTCEERPKDASGSWRGDSVTFRECLKLDSCKFCKIFAEFVTQIEDSSHCKDRRERCHWVLDHNFASFYHHFHQLQHAAYEYSYLQNKPMADKNKNNRFELVYPVLEDRDFYDSLNLELALEDELLHQFSYFLHEESQ